MLSKLLCLTLVALPKVLAHGGVLSVSFAGKLYNGWVPYNTPDGQSSIIRPWATYNPIQDATDPTLACNDDGTSPSGQQTATVAAGSTVVAYWNQVWPHNTGPMLMYLANCGGSTCTGVNANSLKWFKIFQSGLVSGSIYNGTWAAGQMIAQNSSWTFTIPSTVPSGNYLLRMETIALHSMPAQFYPECAQISITGGGSLAPTAAQLVTFPGGYSNTDPGLDIDIYSNQAQTTFNYTIPGPPLYGSSTTGTGNPGTGSSTVVTTSKPTSTVATSSPASSPTAVGTVQEYGQCGGQGWTGATACVSPFTCRVSNQYYSQCLP